MGVGAERAGQGIPELVLRRLADSFRALLPHFVSVACDCERFATAFRLWLLVAALRNSE